MEAKIRTEKEEYTLSFIKLRDLPRSYNDLGFRSMIPSPPLLIMLCIDDVTCFLVTQSTLGGTPYCKL